MPTHGKTRDARQITPQIRQKLSDLIDTLRSEVREVEDPRAEALFETTAEVLTGLEKAYTHYEEEAEAAWR